MRCSTAANLWSKRSSVGSRIPQVAHSNSPRLVEGGMVSPSCPWPDPVRLVALHNELGRRRELGKTSRRPDLTEARLPCTMTGVANASIPPMSRSQAHPVIR